MQPNIWQGKIILQVGLLASIPLPAGGRPAIHRNSCFQFCQQNFDTKKFAQGLSRAHSAFSRFMSEYLDKVIKADQCAQYVDDIGIAANDAEQLINNLRATFQWLQRAGRKLTMHKCQFAATEIDFLGRTIAPAGVKPQRSRVQNFLENTKFPK